MALAGLGLLAGCGMLPSPDRQAARIRRIGYLSFGTPGPGAFEDAFREALAELGYGPDEVHAAMAELPDEGDAALLLKVALQSLAVR